MPTLPATLPTTPTTLHTITTIQITAFFSITTPTSSQHTTPTILTSTNTPVHQLL